ncbi:Hypothetical protein NGAL_HAMBI1146_00170 [Neorhizobium galegae bv. officinalis]|nr:Hypothetical protein NGAL_HAMBI1146_00170 [Neorhizobium galegae bv. officinalis]
MSTHTITLTPILILNIYFSLSVLVLCIFSFVLQSRYRMKIRYVYITLFMSGCYLADIIYLDLMRYGYKGLKYTIGGALFIWPLFYMLMAVSQAAVNFFRISRHRGFSIACFCLVFDSLVTLFLVYS